MRIDTFSMAREPGGFSRPEMALFARAQFLVTLALVAVLLLASAGPAALLTGAH